VSGPEPRLGAAEAGTVLDRLPAIVATWDTDERCRYANAACGRWLGLDPAAVVGMPLADALGAQLYAINREDIAAALAGRPRTLDRVVVNAAGHRRTCQAGYVPLLADDGGVTGLLVHVTDITERLERELGNQDALAREALRAERHRIAEDVHDVVLQDLFAAGLELRAGMAEAPPNPLALRALEAIDDAVTELRSTILAIEEDLAGDGLAAVLHRLVEQAANDLGVVPVLTWRGRLDAVPPALGRTLVAVLVEALAAVTRHARVGRLAVELACSPQEVTLTVSDDGAPGELPAPDLVGMRRLAGLRGGEVSVTTDPRGGTTTSFRTPVPADAPDDGAATPHADLTRLRR
jgi:PAS domain S-box-containing protein